MKKTAALILILILLFTACNSKNIPKRSVPADAPVPAFEVSVRFTAVGDNLIHSPIYKSCKTKTGYDFSCLYENIKPYIENSDIAAINQETVFVNDETMLSGYPQFGTPSEVGTAIADAGFNVVTHATNHVLDKHTSAVFETIEFWKNYPSVTFLGIHESESDAKKIKYFVKDTMKLALLNFTYGLNGFSLPKTKEYLVDVYDSAKASELLKKAESEADITIVFMHFGTEYTHVPNDIQKKWARELCENGADLIVGAHPHVIQNMEKIKTENGREAVVFYSLGNFVSNQEGIDKILGAMADVTITKRHGKTEITRCAMLPLVTHADKKYTVYMLSDYTDELAEKHTRCKDLSVKKLRELFDSVISQNF